MTKTSSVANYYIQTLETFANIFYNYLRLQYFRFELFFCHPTNNELTRHSFCLLVHYPIIVDNQQVLFPFLTFFFGFPKQSKTCFVYCSMDHKFDKSTWKTFTKIPPCLSSMINCECFERRLHC